MSPPNHSPRFTTAHQAIKCLECGEELDLLDGLVWASKDHGADCPVGPDTGWWRLEVADGVELDSDDRAFIAELILQGFTSGQVVHTPTDPENRLTIVPIKKEPRDG